MITQFTFDIDEAVLVYTTIWETGVSGAQRHIIRPLDRARNEVCVTVKEGDHAWLEFKKHFGCDSAWPPGWWDRLQVAA